MMEKATYQLTGLPDSLYEENGLKNGDKVTVVYEAAGIKLEGIYKDGEITDLKEIE